MSRRRPSLLAIVLLLAGCRPATTASPTTRPEAVDRGATAATPTRPHELHRIDDGLPSGSWPSATPAEAGLDAGVLAGLLREAEATDTDALLVIVDGHTVIERYFDRPQAPIETMSVTKSIVALAIFMLIADGRIPSLDAPLSTWFRDWKKGRKAGVTLRHVLTHTSGLAHRQGAGVLTQQSDRTAFARGSEIVDTPGQSFSYNNEAVQLLDGVVRAASGTTLDRYLDERLFGPLQITRWSWERDPAGNVQAFYGLALHARDLAKIGMLMLDGGRVGDRVLVPEALVTAATTEQVQRSGCGLLWWIRRAATGVALRPTDVDTLVRHDVARADTLTDLVGRRFGSSAALWLEIAARTDPRGRAALEQLANAGVRPFAEQPGDVLGFAADGWLGQQLIVLPEHRLVAVRQHRAPTDAAPDDAYNDAHGFFGLIRWLELAATTPHPQGLDPNELQ